MRVASRELRVASCELRVASCELRVDNYRMDIVFVKFFSVLHYLIQSTKQQLPNHKEILIVNRHFFSNEVISKSEADHMSQFQLSC